MLSLRWVRSVGWLLLPVLVACSNGRGSLEEQDPAAPGAQDSFTVGGSVSGLTGSGLVLQNNGGGDLPVTADGAFTFSPRLATGTAYSVAVLAQPTSPSQTCTVARGSGSIAGASVADVGVTCATGRFSIRGTVSGLTGDGLVLQNNGGNDLPVAAAAREFAFANRLVDGAAYTVTVRTQPSGQNCVVRNPAGTISGADASTVEVSCASDSFTIGGRVNGLAGSGLVVQLNRGNDLSIVANGTFAFGTALSNGASYEVSVRRQPTGPSQVCSVASGAGTVAGNVTGIVINCASSSFAVGGTVSGLAGTGLVLQLNGDAALPIASNGSFTFGTAVTSGSQYRVNVAVQPSNPTQVCTVAGGAGTMGSTNVTNVRVTCASSTFSVGGTVIGLLGSGLVLQNNGGDDVAVSAEGLFTFPAELASGAAYSVSVRTQPTNPNQACTVTNARGTIGSVDVGNVVVSCSTADFSIGGVVQNLEGSDLRLRNNGGDELTIDAGGTFVFDTALPGGSRYDVTIARQPRDPEQTCAVANGSGFVGNGNVTSIVVECTTRDFSVGGDVSRLRGLGGLVIQNNGADDLQIGANGPFTFSTRLPSGAQYNVTIRKQPLFDRCDVRHGSGTVREKDIRDVEIRCDR